MPAHLEAFLAIQPEQTLVVHQEAFPAQHHVQPTIAEAATFMRDRLHPVTQRAVVWSGAVVSHRHAAAANGFTRPPFAIPWSVTR
jgi:hypothetical protein